MTEKRSAASRIERAMGPTCASVGVAEVGQTGTRAKVPFIPAKPVNADGIRIDPPPSVPKPIDVTPAAIEAAAPALEPPGVMLIFHGLRVMPVRGESPTGLHPNSLVVVLPIIIAPDLRTRSTAGASLSAIFSANVCEPNEKGASLTDIRSLTDIGSPCSLPSFVPDIKALSAALASSTALSAIRA